LTQTIARSTRSSRLLTRAVLPAGALLLATSVAAADDAPDRNPLPSQPGDFSLKVEPGVAVPLTTPQSQIYSPGAGESIKALWLLNRYLNLGPSATFIYLPAQAAQGDGGTAWNLGVSLGLRRPHDLPDDAGFFGISPWVDVDALYVRTGGLDRPGFDVGVGLAVPIGKQRIFWVGPFARYLQILQIDRTGYDNHDAKILSAGISLEVTFGVEREAAATPYTASPAATTATATAGVCPDRDGDGIPDSVDRCPDVAGTMDDYGCPTYKRIVVKPDKLELKEKIQFAWDQATLQEVSYPVLDEVVQALKDNKSFKVQVEGHTSSEGTDDHNQTLSNQRAQAVLDYLAAHGIGKDRLASKGFSSSVPIDTNATAAGRENNRRVEFVVNFNIIDKGGN
jgi:outer membrane protein OmpA-like peptidoglycan-associated protein